MPYFRDPNLDKNDQQNVQLASGTQTPDMAGSIDGADEQGKPTQSGSKFTNIDSYLQNGNAKGFGEEFGGKIQSGINEAKSNFDTGANAIENKINSSGYVPSQEEINSTVANAGSGTSDEDVKKFQGWTGQSYKGPTSVSDSNGAWDQYWNKANEANTAAKQSGTEAGRFALLDKYYGRPNYNFGEKSLDNLLVQNGGGFNNSQDLQNQAAKLNSYGKQQADKVASDAAQRAGQIEQSKQAANTAVSGAIGNFQSDLDKRVADENQKRLAESSGLYSDFDTGAITDQDYAKLGLTQGEDIYGLNPSQYLTQGQSLNKSNVASDADYAKYAALSKLAGVDPTYLTGAPQAAATPAYSFDKQKLSGDIIGKSQSLQHGLGNVTTDPFYGNNWSNQDLLDAVLKYKNGNTSVFGASPQFGQWAMNKVNEFADTYGAQLEQDGNGMWKLSPKRLGQSKPKTDINSVGNTSSKFGKVVG